MNFTALITVWAQLKFIYQINVSSSFERTADWKQSISFFPRMHRRYLRPPPQRSCFCELHLADLLHLYYFQFTAELSFWGQNKQFAVHKSMFALAFRLLKHDSLGQNNENKIVFESGMTLKQLLRESLLSAQFSAPLECFYSPVCWKAGVSFTSPLLDFIK